MIEGQGLFHKEADDSFIYDELKAYVKADIHKSVGVIEVKGGGHGTCFRVGDKYVMTAFHVVGENGKLNCVHN